MKLKKLVAGLVSVFEAIASGFLRSVVVFAAPNPKNLTGVRRRSLMKRTKTYVEAMLTLVLFSAVAVVLCTISKTVKILYTRSWGTG